MPEQKVKTATAPKIIAMRIQDSPFDCHSPIIISVVLIHSIAPKTKTICTRRAT